MAIGSLVVLLLVLGFTFEHMFAGTRYKIEAKDGMTTKPKVLIGFSIVDENRGWYLHEWFVSCISHLPLQATLAQ